MNDDIKARETLSALVDDEANELELARLLKHPMTPESRAVLRRYQTLSSVLAGQRAVATLDVSARVAAALEDEPVPVPRTDDLAAQDSGPERKAPMADSGLAPERNPALSPRKARRQLFGGAAVAATVALAVVFSSQTFQPNAVEPPAQLAQAPAVPSPDYSELRSSATRAEPSVRLASTPLDDSTMNEAQMRRLNEYLLRHAEHAARSNGQTVVPFARMAGFESSRDPQQ